MKDLALPAPGAGCVCVVVVGGGVTSYNYQYRDVPLEYVYFSAKRLYDKVSFFASNYMNSHTFPSAHYINSLLISQFRQQTSFSPQNL